MAKIDVLGKRRIPAADRARLGKFDLFIPYRVNDDPRQVYHVVIAEESYSQQAEETAIKQDLASRGGGSIRSFST